MEMHRTFGLSEMKNLSNVHFASDVSALSIIEIMTTERFRELKIKENKENGKNGSHIPAGRELYSDPSFAANNGGTIIIVRSVNPESHVKSKLERMVAGFLMCSDILLADNFTESRDSYMRKIEQVMSLLDKREANYVIYSASSVSRIT